MLDLPAEIGEHGAPAEENDMTIMMPASDQAVLGRRDKIVAASAVSICSLKRV